MLKLELTQIRSWADFVSLAGSVSAKERGDLFELLTKYYLLLDPKYKTQLAHVWLLSEVPQKVRTALNLPGRDQGIDIIAETKTGKYWAIQCKYRGSDFHPLTWREISTFTGLTFGVCTNIEYGLIAYTGGKYTKLLDTAAHIGFLSSDTWAALDEDFFVQVAAALKGVPKKLVVYSPRPHQERAIKNAKNYFSDKKNTRGKLIMPCGAGKSLTGFWLAEELKAKTIVVAVPSLGLIQQTLPVWLREYAAHGQHKTLRWLCVCSDQTVTKNEPDSIEVHTQDLGYPCLTNKEEIAAWFKETDGATPRVIFTTYQSGKVLAEAVREAGIKIDLGIMDEAHKTVGQKDKLFSHLLFDENMPIKRRIFMTATERRYAGQSEEIISMDDPSMYGDTFDLLTFKDALEQQPPILSDYKIITMVIAQEEVAKLVEENKYVRPNGSNEEVEAQMLASMIALRKAMQKYPIKHAVSFHSSIARARDFRAFNDTYAQLNKTFGELDTYHVTGATPSSERKKTISEFAKADRALITNARCLTEGIDVPNIDCVLFADPKQSTIDIVQAVGRALRPSKGKKYGYVIVPIISAGEDADDFIETTAFASIVSVLRALASNDERIIEHFRAIHNGRRIKGGTVEIEVDERVAMSVDLETFAEKIETQVWGRLAQLSWQSYEEVSELAQNLQIKSQSGWRKYCKGLRPDLPVKPLDVPNRPDAVYKDFFRRGGWGTFLATGTLAPKDRTYLPYDEAVRFVHALGIKTQLEWEDYCKGSRQDLPPKPKTIPTNPDRYPEFRKRGGIGAWLGTGRKHGRDIEWRSYDDALKFVHALKLKSSDEWSDYCKGLRSDLPAKPADIPTAVHNVYKKEFNRRGGMGAWLGTPNGKTRNIKWRTYDEAIAFVHPLGLRTESEWREYCKGKRPDLPQRPFDIPASPSKQYEAEFKKNGIAGWLGSDRTSYHRNPRRPYGEAVEFVNTLGLKTGDEWTRYCRGEMAHLPPKPIDIPSDPHGYGDEFRKNNGMYGWLGPSAQEYRRNKHLLKYKTYEDALKFVHKLKLKSGTEWQEYCRGLRKDLPLRPKDIPGSPQETYGKEFIERGGFGAWLGTGRVANQLRKYRSYDEAVKFVRSLGLKSLREWNAYCRGERTDIPPKPEDIPNGPYRAYGDDFTKKGGMGAWLGTGRRIGGWLPYKEAVLFVHKLKLKNQLEWSEYRRGERTDLPDKPSNIPGSPLSVYGKEFSENGGWGAWLGNGNRQGAGWRSYAEAVKFVHSLKLKNHPEWRDYTRGDRPDLPSRPSDIPRDPLHLYGDEF